MYENVRVTGAFLPRLGIWPCFVINQSSLPGPLGGHEDARPQPHGAGDHRLDQQHRQERLHLLPRVLCSHPQEVQRR